MKSVLTGSLINGSELSVTFIDTSEYNKDIPIEQPVLQITLPYANPKTITYLPKGQTQINSKSFEVGSLSALPQGLWRIKQMICPHDKVYSEYFWVNTFELENEISTLYCDGKNEEAEKLARKVLALQYLGKCKDEKKILNILDTLNLSNTCSCTCKAFACKEGKSKFGNYKTSNSCSKCVGVKVPLYQL